LRPLEVSGFDDDLEDEAGKDTCYDGDSLWVLEVAWDLHQLWSSPK
jgi:hypothetical protein